MANLRRKLWGRSAGEDTAPVDEELGTETTDPTPEVERVETTPEVEPVETTPEVEPVETTPEVEPVETTGEDDELPVDENPVVEKPHRGLRGSLALALVQSAHIKQAVTTALVVGGVGMVAGRSAREVGVIILTVLTGQAILGWHNDLTDRARDTRHQTPGKPLADGRLEPGTVWYAIVVGALVLVPLAVTTGITAGCLYLASVAVGMLGNVMLRTGVLSWWSWALSFALLPYYLSYGGWGGRALGPAPEPAMVVLAALLGIGIHFMRSVWGLVADHEDGWTYLPLKLAMKVGATRLLAIATAYTVVIAVLFVIIGAQVGLSR